MTGSCLASYVSGFDSKSYHSKREFGEVSYNMAKFSCNKYIRHLATKARHLPGTMIMIMLVVAWRRGSWYLPEGFNFFYILFVASHGLLYSLHFSHYGNQSRGYLIGGGPLWPPTVPLQGVEAWAGSPDHWIWSFGGGGRLGN